MKISKNLIKNKIASIEIKLISLNNKYSNLSQIDMLSGEGNMLLNKINQLKGMLKAFDWILVK